MCWGPGNRLEVGAENEAGGRLGWVSGVLRGQAGGCDGVSWAKTVHENWFSYLHKLN